MGTNGLVAFVTDKVNDDSPILGVTSDGFIENLCSLAQEAFIEACRMGKLLSFQKGEREIVKEVLSFVSKKNDGWCFVDIYNNADWIDYSVVINVKTGKITMWEGNFERPYILK
jgi:hypothetical protein